MSATTINWKAVAAARLHPTQTKVLELLEKTGGLMSPVGLSREVDVPLANASYHFIALRNMGLLEWDHSKPRRGARENFYKLAPEVMK